MAMTAKSERGTAKSKNGKKYTFAVVFIASICAILLWLYVLGYESPNYDKNFTQVEVTVIGVNDLIEKTGFTVLTDLSFSFDVTLTGRKTDINSLRTKDITAYVNVANVKKPGEIYLPVEVKVPNGVKVVNQSSSSACIYIDELVTREIPIRIELSDYSIPGDLSIGSQQITPSTVTVTGPKTELLKIEEAYASIKPGIINTSFSTNVSVTLYKKGGEEVKNTYIKLDDSNVTVFTPVLKTKKIPVKVYFVGGVFSVENAIISLSDQYITVRGTAAAVDALSEIAVNIDETTLLVSSSISKKIILPDGVDNISGKESVSANITLLQMGTRVVSEIREKFEIINVPENVDLQVLTQTLNIKFVGPIDALRNYGTDYFKIVVDLAGIELQSGMNIFVPAKIVFLKPISGLYANGDYSVNVTVN